MCKPYVYVTRLVLFARWAATILSGSATGKKVRGKTNRAPVVLPGIGLQCTVRMFTITLEARMFACFHTFDANLGVAW